MERFRFVCGTHFVKRWSNENISVYGLAVLF